MLSSNIPLIFVHHSDNYAASHVSSNADVQGKIWVLYRLERVVEDLNPHQKTQFNKSHTISTVKDIKKQVMREKSLMKYTQMSLWGSFNPNHT